MLRKNEKRDKYLLKTKKIDDGIKHKKTLEIQNEKNLEQKFGKAGSKSGAVLGDILGKVFSSKKAKKKK